MQQRPPPNALARQVDTHHVAHEYLAALVATICTLQPLSRFSNGPPLQRIPGAVCSLRRPQTTPCNYESHKQNSHNLGCRCCPTRLKNLYLHKHPPADQLVQLRCVGADNIAVRRVHT